MRKKLIGIKRRNKRESGYTLLEYCAGAAIITTVLWTALTTLGADISGLLTKIGGWATARSSLIDDGGTP